MNCRTFVLHMMQSAHCLIPRLGIGLLGVGTRQVRPHIIFPSYDVYGMAMYCFLSVAMLVVYLVEPLLGEVLHDGQVFQVYPRPEDLPNGTTPLYFALMQSFSGGYVSAGGIPGLMVALDEINRNSTVLPGYSLHYTLSDNAVGNR